MAARSLIGNQGRIGSRIATLTARAAKDDTSVDEPGSADFSVDTAIARVLRCEADAQAGIARAREQADQRAEQARARARDCTERSRTRIARGRDRVAQRLQRELAQLQAQARALPDTDLPDAGERARVERAVHALAAALTGGRDGAPA